MGSLFCGDGGSSSCQYCLELQDFCFHGFHQEDADDGGYVEHENDDNDMMMTMTTVISA